jgi:hypothetical protein
MKSTKNPELLTLGKFEFGVLKDLLPALERHGIPFETAGDSVLGRLTMRVNANPSGPAINVIVPAARHAEAEQVVASLYSVEP